MEIRPSWLVVDNPTKDDVLIVGSVKLEGGITDDLLNGKKFIMSCGEIDTDEAAPKKMLIGTVRLEEYSPKPDIWSVVYEIVESMDKESKTVGWFDTITLAREYYLEHVPTTTNRWDIWEIRWVPGTDDWDGNNPVRRTRVNPVEHNDHDWLEYQRLSQKFGRLPKTVVQHPDTVSSHG